MHKKFPMMPILLWTVPTRNVRTFISTWSANEFLCNIFFFFSLTRRFFVRDWVPRSKNEWFSSCCLQSHDGWKLKLVAKEKRSYGTLRKTKPKCARNCRKCRVQVIGIETFYTSISRTTAGSWCSQRAEHHHVPAQPTLRSLRYLLTRLGFEPEEKQNGLCTANGDPLFLPAISVRLLGDYILNTLISLGSLSDCSKAA